MDQLDPIVPFPHPAGMLGEIALSAALVCVPDPGNTYKCTLHGKGGLRDRPVVNGTRHMLCSCSTGRARVQDALTFEAACPITGLLYPYKEALVVHPVVLREGRRFGEAVVENRKQPDGKRLKPRDLRAKFPFKWPAIIADDNGIQGKILRLLLENPGAKYAPEAREIMQTWINPGEHAGMVQVGDAWLPMLVPQEDVLPMYGRPLKRLIESGQVRWADREMIVQRDGEPMTPCTAAVEQSGAFKTIVRCAGDGYFSWKDPLSSTVHIDDGKDAGFCPHCTEALHAVGVQTGPQLYAVLREGGVVQERPAREQRRLRSRPAANGGSEGIDEAPPRRHDPHRDGYGGGRRRVKNPGSAARRGDKPRQRGPGGAPIASAEEVRRMHAGDPSKYAPPPKKGNGGGKKKGKRGKK